MFNKNTDLLLLKVLFIYLLFSASIYAYSTKVTGYVIDIETSQPIPVANVKIVENSFNFVTDDNGSFTVPKLDFGEYTFVITRLGYEENVSKVSIDKKTGKNIVFYLIPESIELGTVVVSEYKTYSKIDDLSKLTSELKGKALDKELGMTLASTLKNEAGLAMRSMGPAPSRPVIRGLGSNRVVITEDGIATTDLSATSPDHAVTVDPFTISRIEVVRGPKVLTQTPVTIGGVINVVQNEIPETQHQSLFGTAGTFAETANKSYLGYLSLEQPIENFSIKGQISKRKASNLNTPVGELNNSESENMIYNIAGSYIGQRDFIGASYQSFDLDYGIPGGFVGAHPSGVDITMYKKRLKLIGKINFENSLIDNIELKSSRVLYRHKEFEASGTIGSEFKILTYLGELNFNHNKLGFIKNGTWGITSNYRDFTIGGFVFTPPTKSFNFAAYFFENVDYDKLNFQFAGRYNFDTITPDSNYTAKIGEIRKRTFNTYSLSFTALYELSNVVYCGINLSKSSRVPTIEELYSEGPHLAAYSYEVGNPDLQDEKGIGSEIFLYTKFDNLFFNLSFFRNDLSNYIIPRNTGETNWATFLPIYKTSGVRAILWGAESSLDWKIIEPIHLANTIGFTIGKFKDGENLPQIPPLKGLLELKYVTNTLSFGTGIEWAAKQDKLDEFEEPTNGYIVNNLFIQYLFNYGVTTNTVSLNLDNIFDVEYRNHLSRVKSILPEAGINIRLSYKLFFHY